ncbi:MAG: hypothetical protein NC097_05245 [Clostridium sp.]|nr:hypothetical protein [Prevotella sp.]MCM1429182.1 hypothetical protein [Clostridium sp.]MCM1475844.1 hypothetical protein [Muribaculaceae bacterium]
MKKSVLLYSALASFALLCSCSRSSEVKIEYFPFQEPEGDEWQMISPEGRILSGVHFDNMPTVATDGVFWARNHKGYWEMYHIDGDKAEKLDGEYRYATIFKNGHALVAKRDENVSVINTKGEVTADLSKIGSYTPDQCMNFNDDLFTFTVNEKQGLADIKGNPIIKPVMGQVFEPHDGKVVSIDSIGLKSLYSDTIAGSYYVYNYKGEELLKLSRSKYSMVSDQFSGDYLSVAVESGNEDAPYKWGIIDVTGKEVVKPNNKYRIIGDINKVAYTYYDGEHWGVNAFDGKKLLAPKYDIVELKADGTMIVGKQDNSVGEGNGEGEGGEMQYAIIGPDGKAVSKDKFRTVFSLPEGSFLVQNDDEVFSIINKKGEFLKNIPDMSNAVVYSMGDFNVESDKVNLKALVGKIGFTADTMGPLTFNSSVRKAIEYQSDSYSATNKPKASDFSYTDELYVYKRVEGVNVSQTIKFPEKLSHQNYRTEQVIDFWIGWTYYYHTNQIPTGHTFTTTNPKYFQLQFDNYGKLRGKLKPLFKELCAKFAKMGTLEDSNGAAALYRLNNGKYALISLEPHNVTVKWGNLSSSDRELYPFYGNKEDLSWNDSEEVEGDI